MLPLSWRMYRWWGTSPASDVVHIGRWGTTRRTELVTAVTWWPTRVGFVDASKLEERTIAGLVETVNRHRPDLVEGYVGALYEIARYVDRHGLEFHPPTALGATAAPLTREVRDFVEATLGAPLHDQYRCSEVPWMAGECGRRDGLHVFSDLRRIEAVDEYGHAAATRRRRRPRASPTSPTASSRSSATGSATAARCARSPARAGSACRSWTRPTAGPST